jgi:hypothetical protein
MKWLTERKGSEEGWRQSSKHNRLESRSAASKSLRDIAVDTDYTVRHGTLADGVIGLWFTDDDVLLRMDKRFVVAVDEAPADGNGARAGSIGTIAGGGG